MRRYLQNQHFPGDSAQLAVYFHSALPTLLLHEGCVLAAGAEGFLSCRCKGSPLKAPEAGAC